MKSRIISLIFISLFFIGCSSQQMRPGTASKSAFHVPEKWDKPISQRETSGNDTSSKSGPISNSTPENGDKETSFQPDFKENNNRKTAVTATTGEQMLGVASWYGPGFHGKKTANGERYDQNEMTAAHKILPMDTWVQVTNLENKRAIVVRINDRGPYKKQRIIDLTKAAAEQLGFKDQGTTNVALKVVKYPKNFDHSEGLNPYKQVVIQIAVFKGEKRAYNFKDQLSRRYHKIPFMIDDSKETGFHVVAGPYDEREDAIQIAHALKKEGIDNFIRSYKK